MPRAATKSGRVPFAFVELSGPWISDVMETEALRVGLGVVGPQQKLR